MRDPEFEVSSVRESDVIHANKKDVPCIFRVTTSLMDPPGVRHQCLMLADTESEKTKWVVALNELHRILKKNNLPSRIVFRCREVLDNTVSIIKNSNALSACLIDRDRMVVGTDDGLFCVDLDRDEICRIGDGKKIHQVHFGFFLVLFGDFLKMKGKVSRNTFRFRSGMVFGSDHYFYESTNRRKHYHSLGP